MSGWIKVEKDLVTDPRFLRLAKSIGNADVTHERSSHARAVTQALGCLTFLWIYADTHVRDDDTLDLGVDEINEIVGVEGFAQAMPEDWLEVLDAHRVKLPGFHAHNGTEAKKRALTQKRVARHRIRSVTQERNPDTTGGNAPALPDQDQDQDRDQDQTSLRSSSPRPYRSSPSERGAGEGTVKNDRLKIEVGKLAAGMRLVP